MKAALVVAACVALGAAGAMGVSGLLNKTCLRGKNSLFILEIPPFRRPRLGQILIRSVFVVKEIFLLNLKVHRRFQERGGWGTLPECSWGFETGSLLYWR